MFGYYAEGVELGTAVLLPGWRNRLVPIRSENTRGVTGLCLEVDDLLISKYVAGREKGLEYCQAVMGHRMADATILLERLKGMDIDEQLRASVAARIKRDWSSVEES